MVFKVKKVCFWYKGVQTSTYILHQERKLLYLTCILCCSLVTFLGLQSSCVRDLFHGLLSRFITKSCFCRRKQLHFLLCVLWNNINVIIKALLVGSLRSEMFLLAIMDGKYTWRYTCIMSCQISEHILLCFVWLNESCYHSELRKKAPETMNIAKYTSQF